MSLTLPSAFRPTAIGEDYTQFNNSIQDGRNTAVFYATQSARYYLTTECKKFFLYIAKDRGEACTAQQRLQEFVSGDVVLIREKEDVLLNAQVVSSSALQDRLTALTKIYERTAVGAVISLEGLAQMFPSVDAFSSSLIRIKVGDCISRDDLVSRLILGGYRKEDVVDSAGEFAIRGEIVDIFAMNTALPVRIEFFDDEVEGLRYYAPDSMVSVQTIDSVVISPRSDILISPDLKEDIKLKLTREIAKSRGKLFETFANIMQRFELNSSDPSLVWLLPFIRKYQTSIFSYLPENSIVVLDEPRQLDEKLRLQINAHNMRAKSFADAGEVSKSHVKSLYNQEEIYAFLQEQQLVSFQNLTSSNPIFKPEALHSLHCQSVSQYHQSNDRLASDIRQYLEQDCKVCVLCGNQYGAEALQKTLSNHGFIGKIATDGEGEENLILIPQKISEGFIVKDCKRVVLGTDNIMASKATPQKAEDVKIKLFTVPEVGSLVVHDIHGLGIFEGITAVDSKLGKQDFYTILYREGSRLYLPVNQIDSVEKYVGGGKPKLDAIGGKEFSKVKEKVKASTKEFAIDLLALYESRMARKGFVYEADTVWQQEMEESFPFQETQDQLIAVAEIKQDMENGKLMDRLVCGDVGFGKTEVAIRAIFKTIMGGKQTAILCPTTILCQQHFNTISMRLKNYGFKIDMLSRMESKESMNGSLKRIKSGETNIVIATHRLLSKDVVFKDLGLLVLDEEQRFGVEHKEKIKLLKRDVNVLTLSATPIPRTLHMSLTGIRDISTLATPPKTRIPVETHVVEYSDSLVKDAITRELARGGQVYIMKNRVQGLDEYANSIAKLMGDGVRITYAHGQMDPLELEARVKMFYDKKVDVLISTSIIENGIDVPEANTLIVLEADRLGLSTLYQLRGRVGRSDILAYSYFTIRKDKVLNADAQKRLDALTSYTELGSGFKIAMRDMEIRGAGNVLGKEQHGDMVKVGYEMYCRILSDCVNELQGKPKEEHSQVEVISEGDFSLPQHYIYDVKSRTEFYKKMSIVSSFAEQKLLMSQTRDAYGTLPQSVINMIALCVIKNLASKIGVKTVMLSEKTTCLVFNDPKMFQNEKLVNAVAKCNKKTKVCGLTAEKAPRIVFTVKFNSVKDRLAWVEQLLIWATA